MYLKKLLNFSNIIFKIFFFSNGGGRSGAFLTLDANLELLHRTGQVNVFDYAKTLVNSRQHLIDSVDQYMFLYDVLCEAVLCNIQPIAMYQLKERSSMYKARKNRELMELQDSHENKVQNVYCFLIRFNFSYY